MMLLRQRLKGLVAISGIVGVSGCASASRHPAANGDPVGVSDRATVVYYDVHGRTFSEVAAALRKQGPKIHWTSLMGETRSPIAWNLGLSRLGVGTCQISDVYLTVSAQVLWPRWTPPADAEPGLAVEWTRFITALSTHEAGHRNISATAGREIVDQIRGLSGPCSQISTRGNDIARRIVERDSTAQAQYDNETGYGATQGTTFRIASADSADLVDVRRPGRKQRRSAFKP